VVETGLSGLLWLKRFARGRFAGLPDPTRPGFLVFCIVIARAIDGGLVVAIPAALYWGLECSIGFRPC